MRWVVLVVLVAAIVALACRNKPSTPSVVKGDECTNNATATAVIADVRTSLASNATDVAETLRSPDSEVECRLRPVLFNPKDFPGWTKGRLGEQIRDTRPPRWLFDSTTSCSTPARSALGGLQVVLQNGDATIGQTVIAFEPGNAERFMEGLRHNCGISLARTSPDIPDDFVYAPAPQPGLGDDSFALHVTAFLQNDDPGINEHAIFVRRGDVIAAAEIIQPESSSVRIDELGRRMEHAMQLLDPMPQPTPVAGEGCSPPPTPPSNENQSLRALSLSLEDMPVGWTPRFESRCGPIDIQSNCDRTPGSDSPEPVDMTTVGFDGYGSFFREDVERLKGVPGADRIRRARERLSSPYECDVSSGDVRFKWRVELVDCPELPEAEICVRLRSIGLAENNSSERELVIYSASFDRGDVLIRLTYRPPDFFGSTVASDEVDPQDERFALKQMTPLVQKARAKVDANMAH